MNTIELLHSHYPDAYIITDDWDMSFYLLYVSLAVLSAGIFFIGKYGRHSVLTCVCLFLFTMCFYIVLFSYQLLAGNSSYRFIDTNDEFELFTFLLFLALLLVTISLGVSAYRAAKLANIYPEKTGTASHLSRLSAAGILGAIFRNVVALAIVFGLLLSIFLCAFIFDLVILKLMMLIVGNNEFIGLSVIQVQEKLVAINYVDLVREGQYAKFAGITGLGTLKIAGYVTAFVLIVKSFRFSQRLRRKSADSVVRNPAVSPVLLLRSFADDGIKIRGRSLRSALFRKRYNLEEIIAEDLRYSGPFIAVGQPSDQLAPLGAYRSYHAEDRWRKIISDWMVRSQRIVAICGLTPSFSWELDQICALNIVHKTLFLFPPGEYSESMRRWVFVRAKIERYLRPDFELPLAPVKGTLCFLIMDQGVYFFTGGTLSAVDYQVAMRLGAVKMDAFKNRVSRVK